MCIIIGAEWVARLAGKIFLYRARAASEAAQASLAARARRRRCPLPPCFQLFQGVSGEETTLRGSGVAQLNSTSGRLGCRASRAAPAAARARSASICGFAGSFKRSGQLFDLLGIDDWFDGLGRLDRIVRVHTAARNQCDARENRRQYHMTLNPIRRERIGLILLTRSNRNLWCRFSTGTNITSCRFESRQHHNFTAPSR